MPINYKDYPKDWKSVIVPTIRQRSGDKCETCGIKNKLSVMRGIWNGKAVYQDEDGRIYRESDSAYLGGDYIGSVNSKRITKVVLTVAHIDHDKTNNDISNLRHLCQKCHLNLDKNQHLENSRITRERKKGLVRLF